MPKHNEMGILFEYKHQTGDRTGTGRNGYWMKVRNKSSFAQKIEYTINFI